MALGTVTVTVNCDVESIEDALAALRREIANVEQRVRQVVVDYVDPYMPSESEWAAAPEWAQFHTIDNDGRGIWWRSGGIVLGDGRWYHDIDTLNSIHVDERKWIMDGLDWCNSLRAKPGNDYFQKKEWGAVTFHSM